MADKNYLHIAYAYSADGTDRFTTVYPNLNLLTGTKDFSGEDWINVSGVPDDGTFKGLVVKSKSSRWNGIYKNYTIPEDGDYVFSVYISASADGVNPAMVITKNGTIMKNTVLSTTMFDMQRFYYVCENLKKGDVVSGRADKSGTATGKVSVAGHKWEKSSIATPWMPSSSEVTSKDYPTYIGTYTDENETSSTNPADYTWEMMNYRIYLDGIAVAGSKLLSAKVENLKPDTSYTIQVKQVSEEEESDFSDSVTFKTNVQK
ncbi:fibronectin type III domain-containing protein [Lactococcus formosensis subsp. formosensis]|uniref:fibronectin type III domain-containing protein n=1 Tax=Lactococcus formosensis TaxID=1281486 RepID=UPI003853EE0E